MKSKLYNVNISCFTFVFFSGYKSWRLPDKGSWFIRTLVKVFMYYAKTDHVIELLTRVSLLLFSFSPCWAKTYWGIYCYLILRIFSFKYNLDNSSRHSKLDPIGVRTDDLQIMDNTFYVPEMLVLTTEPSGTPLAPPPPPLPPCPPSIRVGVINFKTKLVKLISKFFS